MHNHIVIFLLSTTAFHTINAQMHNHVVILLSTTAFHQIKAQIGTDFGNITCAPGEYSGEEDYDESNGYVQSGWGNCHDPLIGELREESDNEKTRGTASIKINAIGSLCRRANDIAHFHSLRSLYFIVAPRSSRSVQEVKRGARESSVTGHGWTRT